MHRPRSFKSQNQPLLRKDKTDAPSIMFELWTWAKDTVAEKNDHADIPQQNYYYDSDEYFEHILDHLYDKEHQYLDWDESTMQQIHFSTDFYDSDTFGTAILFHNVFHLN